MGRNIDDHGRNLVVRVYPEVQEHLKSYHRRLAWRRKNGGEDVAPGELRGQSHALGRVLCWLATLSDADQLRIQQEGGKLLDRLHEMPAEYDGAFPFEQRRESALA